MRLIEVIADAGHTDTLSGLADQHEVTDYWWGAPADDGRRSFRMLVEDSIRQPVMDALQGLFGGSDNVRIVILPVDTVLPREPEPEDSPASATREELYTQIEKGTRVDSNFFLLTVLSTIVAAIGLIEDNVAVIIGAMVIAPLLGPNIALAFATSVGDAGLSLKALKASVVGLGTACLLAVGIGLLWPVDLWRGQLLVASTEIIARTDVGLDGMALALASGAAAVLSLTTGLSSTLVGVMVAVALLPPTATFGMLIGAGHWELALGAFLLLAVNIVCVIVAAKAVFLAKGIRPRTWYQRRRAQQSTVLYGAMWAVLLVVLLMIVLLRRHVVA
jgi:uncharacterized hydrophobic protein (TIGR00341 family)